MTPSNDTELTNETISSSDEKTVDYADAIAAQIFDLFDDGKPLSYQARGLTLSDICVLAVKTVNFIPSETLTSSWDCDGQRR